MLVGDFFIFFFAPSVKSHMAVSSFLSHIITSIAQSVNFKHQRLICKTGFTHILSSYGLTCTNANTAR